MNILLTGATGFIGQRLTRKLASGGHHLFILVRPESRQKAEKMFAALPKVTFVEGDIEDTDVIRRASAASSLLDQIEAVVHLAALYDLKASLSDAYIKNVLGTQNILQLVSRLINVRHLFYFSTYAVNPVAQGAVNEDFLVGDDLPFHDMYAKTKNHGEHLVRKFKKEGLSTVIFRPGIIIGDSTTGEMEKIDGPYYLYEFAQKLKKLDGLKARLPFLPMPIKASSNLPLLPVNVLTEWCERIIANPPGKPLRCYHLVPAPMIKTKDFLEASLELLGLPLKILPISQTKLIAPFLPLMNIPTQAAFYMNQQTVFDRSHLTEDYPELQTPYYQQYLSTIVNGYLSSRRRP